MSEPSSETIARKARWLEQFAETCRDRSPLYSHLARSLADDPQLLPMTVSPRNHPPHILLAAVHYLLLKGEPHQLAKFYPSVSGSAENPHVAYPAFRDFCLSYQTQIQQLVASRLLQTNEVGRCSYLYLAFGLISALTRKPLALLEIGTAAGLNLVWDKYAYQFDDDDVVGDPTSRVLVKSQLRGALRPVIHAKPPQVACRWGIDLNTIDLDDADQVLWARSLLWPEQKERADRLAQAIQVTRKWKPKMIEGDGLAELTDRVRALPRDAAGCVFHTHSIHTWSEEERDTLAVRLAELSAERPWLFRLSAEWLEPPSPKLSVTSWDSDGAHTTLLARCDDHGRWVEWLSE